jgi:hypothetical protein
LVSYSDGTCISCDFSCLATRNKAMDTIANCRQVLRWHVEGISTSAVFFPEVAGRRRDSIASATTSSPGSDEDEFPLPTRDGTSAAMDEDAESRTVAGQQRGALGVASASASVSLRGPDGISSVSHGRNAAPESEASSRSAIRPGSVPALARFPTMIDSPSASAVSTAQSRLPWNDLLQHTNVEVPLKSVPFVQSADPDILPVFEHIVMLETDPHKMDIHRASVPPSGGLPTSLPPLSGTMNVFSLGAPFHGSPRPLLLSSDPSLTAADSPMIKLRGGSGANANIHRSLLGKPRGSAQQDVRVPATRPTPPLLPCWDLDAAVRAMRCRTLRPLVLRGPSASFLPVGWAGKMPDSLIQSLRTEGHHAMSFSSNHSHGDTDHGRGDGAEAGPPSTGIRGRVVGAPFFLAEAMFGDGIVVGNRSGSFLRFFARQSRCVSQPAPAEERKARRVHAHQSGPGAVLDAHTISPMRPSVIVPAEETADEQKLISGSLGRPRPRPPSLAPTTIFERFREGARLELDLNLAWGEKVTAVCAESPLVTPSGRLWVATQCQIFVFGTTVQ